MTASAIDAIATLVITAPLVEAPIALARTRDALIDTVASMFAGAHSAVAENAAKAVAP